MLRFVILLWMGWSVANTSAYYTSPALASFSSGSTTERRGIQSNFPRCNIFQTLHWHLNRPIVVISLDASRHDLDGERLSKGTEEAKTSSRATKNPTKRRTWDESYARLLDFIEEHGHANVPRGYKQDPKLGRWVVDQRSRRFSMSPEKREKLEDLNLTWDGVDKEKYDQQWAGMCQRLENYKEVEGDCCVPGEYEPDQKLAIWVKRQRQQYTWGKLSPDRIRKLEYIGFVWRLRDFFEREREDLEEQWKKKLEELLEYRKDNGHCRVPRLSKEYPQLARWVHEQRENNRDGLMRKDRKKLLVEIGFTWSFDEIFYESWHDMYDQLLELKKATEEEVRNSPKSTWASPTKQSELYHWELHQQASYKRGTLGSKRESMLVEIGYFDSLGLSQA